MQTHKYIHTGERRQEVSPETQSVHLMTRTHQNKREKMAAGKLQKGISALLYAHIGTIRQRLEWLKLD